jgi:hypothetical protein
MTYLLFMIENKKCRLKELTEQYGMTSEHTIKCSEELDILLNLLHRAVEKRTNIEKK